LVGGLALLLALLATGLVFLYVNNVRDDAENGEGTVTVVVAKEDIPAGTQLDGLVSEGAFDTEAIPEAAVVRGAITDLAQLEGQTTSQAILAGEQISSARLQGSPDQAAGGSLGIPKGFVAVTLPLDGSRIVGGDLQRGDHVTVFATFDSGGAGGGAATTGGQGGDDVTVTLVPDVELLKVVKTVQEGVTGSAPSSGLNSATFALKAKDAQDLVFAQEKGLVWLGLIPPGEKGKQIPPSTLTKVVSR
jgi:pilus assembly protein CpaB